MGTTAMAEWFIQLESNDTEIYGEVKRKFHEQFNFVQDAWLFNGVYDYYLASNSVRSMEILVDIQETHSLFLFNRVDEALKNSKHDLKVKALTLLGHVLRKQPPWLYKITEHSLLKNLLKLLKTETDILLLLSSLLVLVVLLPIVPSRMGQFLQDVFEIFSRLAAWNCSNPEKLVEEQMIHLQVALYALFQRLYGMYPCNFLAYLRNQYRNKEQLPIFVHTVKPMLDTVKMHPLLVTASKDKETTTERWKRMGAHDVVIECERFSLDVSERCQHESCYLTSSFRSRSGTTNSATLELPSILDSSYAMQSMKSTSIASIAYEAKEFFSPSMTLHSQTPPVQDASAPTAIPYAHLQGVGQGLVATIGLSSQEGTSPPEAAIEATPETTPIKDIRITSKTQLPQTATAVRALTNTLSARNWSIGSSGSTPSHSQPSSPMRKEVSPFNFPDNRTSAFGLPRREPYAMQKLQRMIQDRSQVIDGDPTMPGMRSTPPMVHPTSPLRIIPTNESNTSHSIIQRIDSPVSQEDEEVLEIVKQGEPEERPSIRQCDSVLQEGEGGRGTEDDIDCEQEHGSPCAAGGLHMPNSRSMNDFAKRVRRLRYHSQCATEPELPETSTGSSPGNCVPFSSNTVRRANSCPEMKKSPVVPTKDNRNKTLLEADEETGKENSQSDMKQTQKNLTTSETQTENFWPMPYEHLFLSVFPSLESGDIKPSPAPSPAPLNVQDKFPTVSPYEILDKYIDIAVQSTDRDPIKSLRGQLQLLHQQLHFERYRRETHAVKNRRLLADAKSTKALEEHNSALRDQVQLQQRDIDNLKEQLEIIKRELHSKGRQSFESSQLWESKYISLQQEYKILKLQSEKLQQELENMRKKSLELDGKWQKTEAALLHAEADVKIAREQAWAGEKGKGELERVSRQLLLIGEQHQRYREKLAEIPLLRNHEQELILLNDAYNNELKALRQTLEAKTLELEARRARMTELEQTINQNEESFQRFKRLLNEVKEEYDIKMKAVEGKYQTQLQIGRFMDGRILELWQKIELATGRHLHSPDTSSCQEVQVTMTDRTSIATGLSPHSSPLSASLASSEGSIAFGHSDVKNLQNIVDQKDPTVSTSRTSEDLEANELGAINMPQPSTSSKLD